MGTSLTHPFSVSPVMGIPIEDLLPNDVLDEIVVSDQTHVLGYFEENSFTEEDVSAFVNQVVFIDQTHC